ncbi:B2 bradykinin receptor-like [Anoplopoma fimbria]|uniref:B2 bradykinin receptor-like n=1 Tax=Anoplopoma fimbria TaxID=229290 RepID=UPI0023EC9029|nr:B2 bradykinin receptor-like [Anoplopoma fimbria]
MTLLPTSIPANFTTAVMNGDQNKTNVTECHPTDLKEWNVNVIPVYILIIAVLGIVLNLFVLMVFCLHKKACTMAEIYLSNMAAADLFLMVVMPFWAVYAAKNFNWPFTDPLCPLITLAINMNAYCSIYFLVLISIDRYMVLVHPLSHEGMRRPKCAKLGCLVVWCFGLFLSIPTLVYRKVKYYPASNASFCQLVYPSPTVGHVSDVMLMMFSFIIPICIISFCTFRIIKALNNRLTVGSNTKKVDHKATNLMLAVLLAFMICWVPFHLIKILALFVYAKVLTGCTLNAILPICMSVFMYLAFFNSVLNPILYVIVGKNFRKKVRELFKQWSFTRTMTLSTASTRSNMSKSVRTENVSG